jgi:DNA-binding LacI/PurR family transcriptional regulator
MNRPGERTRGAQMRDVAERAGVSISTVSHVANDTRPVASATRARVLEAMRELNFYKNVFGRRLARGRSDALALLISDIENPFFPELIKSFENAVVERGWDVFLCTTNYSSERARKAVRRMIENKVQGVAVMTSQLDADLLEELLAADTPVVTMDGGATGRNRSNIRIDYSQAALDAIKHLRDLGHRRIAYISGPQNRVSAVTYRKAIIDAANALRLPAMNVVPGDNTVEGGRLGAQLLAQQPDAPTAMICGNDLAALGAVQALAELGRRVPRDVSVIGADDIAYARFTTPGLTTIRIPRDRLGVTAFEALDRLIRMKRRAGAEYAVQASLVVRDSTGRSR